MSSAWSTTHSFQNPRSLNDGRGAESQGPSRSSDGSGHVRHQSQAESFASVWTGASSVRTFDVAASFPHPPSTIPLPPPSAHSQSTFRLSPQWKGPPSSHTSLLSQSPASPAFPSPLGGRRSTPHSSAHPSHEDLLSTAFIQQMLNHNSCKSTEDWHSAVVDVNRMSTAGSPRLPYNNDKVISPSVHTSTESQPSPQPTLGASPNSVTTFTTVRRQSTVSHEGESACYEPALVRTASMSFAARATVIGFAPMSHPNASTNAVQALYNPGNWRPLSIAPQQELDRDVLRLPAYPESVRTSHDHANELPAFQEVYVNGRIQSGALPSGASARFPGAIHKRHQSRTSSRSRATSFTSRISKSTQGSKGKKIASAFTWLMNKSLPPLPTPSQEHLPVQVHQRDIKHGRESDIPLPELARRADNLSRMLASGRLPRDSRQSNQIPGYTHEKALSRSRSTTSMFTAVSDRSRRLASGLRNGSTGNFAPLDDDLKVTVGVQAPGSFSERVSFAWTNMSRRRIFIIILLFVLIILGVVLGVVLSRKSTTTPSKVSQCANGRAGALCDLDATCTCTSTASGRCDSLSQSMVSLVPVVNQLFNSTISANELALVLWDLQGDPIDDCSSQAELIDVGPALTMTKYPALTQWASSALLFSLFESQDLNATERMRVFVSANNFTSIANTTNVPAASPQFTTLASGFLYDFGTMAISAPPASFKDGGQPSADQISRVGQTAQNSLDRMYSYSTASSTQRSGALNRYWTSILKLGTGDFNKFLSAMRSAPLMIPVDMAFSRGDDALSNHLPQDDTTSFPPPVACYPGLSTDQISIVNAVEHGAYGLPAITSAAQSFTASCPDRPIYGTLDFMRLRLPYPDSRKGLSMPGIILDSDVAPRVVLRSGELVNALPFNGARQTNAADSNPLEYGTVSQMNHVILTWLESFPTPALAAQVVKYVISSAASSTPTNSTLFTDPTIVASIPTLEIAVFGSILPTDFTTSVSPFANADGSLFFGSAKATQFKNWALRQSSSVVAWTESASSLTVVREHKTTEDAVNQALTKAAQLIQSATDAGTSTGPTDVNTIISSLRQSGAFAP